MDTGTAYTQHASHVRRKNRSTTNLNHLSLAPLTSKLPINDQDEIPDPPQTAPLYRSTSYLQGKSAPTTPRLLSRSPGRSGANTHGSTTPTATTTLTKSKSATHLSASLGTPKARGRHVANSRSGTRSGMLSPVARRRKDDQLSARDRTDSDWLLRAGALLFTETRESKGQAWLVSRASSTNLASGPDPEEAAFEQELAFEREALLAGSSTSRHASRRGSLNNNNIVLGDDDLVMSALNSRLGSRSHSRKGSRSQAITPGERRSGDGYFDTDVTFAEPEFVNLDEKLEAIEQDTPQDDEDHVRRLVKNGNVGTWFHNFLGWHLASVEETDEETDDDGGSGTGGYDDEETETEGGDDQPQIDVVAAAAAKHVCRGECMRHFDGLVDPSERVEVPPKLNEGGWQDAAWLLSVATKVLL